MLTTRYLAPAVLALASVVGGCTDDGTGIADATIEVSNESDFVIEELYLTDVNSSSWGANLLGGDGLFPDESIVLGVDCGFYDALLVDEEGVDCELNDLDLCLNDALWVINNNTCSVFGAKKDRNTTTTAPPADTAVK